jgi:sulfur carrier protein ThiS
MVKVMYESILVGYVLTNRSISVLEALEILGFNEEEFISENNFDDIDYNDFTLKY